jgi:propanol-preferring alcohol dehydrogenase
MQRTMKAAVVRKFREPLAIEEVPLPMPGAGQILVTIVASGVCHTDLHAAGGDWPVKPTLPFIPGHEGVGYVSAIGPGVTCVKEGDRVGVPWLHSACGACDHCLTGWETLCPAQRNTGYTVNGAFAEYVVATAAFVAKIPDKLGFVDAAPILCAGVTTYKGLKETEVRPGQWVAISGIGGLGHVAVQYAKAMGMHVAAVDVGKDKLALARALGAEIAVDARSADPAAELQHLVGGVHGALVTAVSPAAFRQAVGTLRSGGTCVFVGLPPGELAAPIFDVVLKRLTLRGSSVGTRMDLKEALQIAADGRVQPTIELQPLAAINAAFTRLEQGTLRGRIVLAMRDP